MERAIKIVMLILILVSGLAVAGCSSVPAPGQTSSPDNLAPDFQLQSLDGQTVTLGGLRGKPVMLNFWATWCGPCQVEMPYIQEVFKDKEWSDKGLVLWAINVGEPPSRVKGFVEDSGFSFPVLLDTDGGVAQDYNIRSIPTTFFIDKNGIIKDIKIGTFSNKAEIDWRLINSILDSE